MKVFVYDKKTSNTVAIIKNVTDVSESNKRIHITTSDNKSYSHDTKQVKTRIYQN